MSSATARREQILAALNAFAATSTTKAATQLLNALGYASEKTADLGSSAEALLTNIEQFKPELGNINRAKIKSAQWKSCAFLYQLTNDEIHSLAIGQQAFSTDTKLARSLIESFVFLAEEAILDEATAVAVKRVIAWQIDQEMKAQNLTKTSMAKKMHTSRAVLNRLLDTTDTSLTLTTLSSAASVLGKKLRIELEPG